MPKLVQYDSVVYYKKTLFSHIKSVISSPKNFPDFR